MLRLFRKFSYSPNRLNKFSSLTDSHLEYFRSILPGNGVVTEDLSPYNTDWIGIYKGNSSLTLAPKNTTQVSEILKYCNENSLAVVPQSGNTGLVGGSVPVHDEIVLSLKKMDDIQNFDPATGVVITQSGVILENLRNYAEERGYTVPLDLGARGSCLIGGNVATNAGGVNYIRYGSLHGSVVGLEVVLPNGDILDCTQAMRKDNTGYDLKQIFIGSEGTLGVISKVSLALAPSPRHRQLALLALPNFDSVLQLFRSARSQLNEILSAFELIDEVGYELVLKELPTVARPLENKSPFY